MWDVVDKSADLHRLETYLHPREDLRQVPRSYGEAHKDIKGR